MSPQQKAVANPKVRRRSRLVPILWLALVGIEAAAPYKGWVVLLIGLSTIWILGRLWANRLAVGLTIRRESRFGWGQVGDQMLERITVRNASWLPATWVELSDLSTLPIEHQIRTFGIGGRRRYQWYERVVCRRRGRFILGPTALRTGDPFGIYEVEHQIAGESTVLVLPPTIEWQEMAEVAQTGRDEGEVTGPKVQPGVGASQVRPYQPGDSLRWVHWPTSARQGSLYIRQFDSLSAGGWMILVDLGGRRGPGPHDPAIVESVVALGASLACQALARDQAVGLTTLGPGGTITVPVRRGTAQRWDVLSALAEAEPAPVSLEALYQVATGGAAGQAALVVITGAQDAGRLLPWVETGGWVGSAPVVYLVTHEPGGSGRTVAETLAERGFTPMIVPHAEVQAMIAALPTWIERRSELASTAEWRPMG